MLDTPIDTPLSQLIALGKERGSLTFAEVNAALPPDLSSAEIEAFMTKLGELGIDIVDSTRQLENIDYTLKAKLQFEVLTRRGRKFLGTEHAILGGAMSWVSERNLVAAISNAGGFGVIACGAMPPALLEKEIEATKALTDKPFGVNLITMHPQLDELVQVCVRQNVGHVVFAGGIPTTSHIRAAKENGAKVIAFAPALVLAKRLIKSGADALVIEGSEAGGHIGPVSLTVLAQEILPHITEVPVFVAGGLGRGEAILGYLEMGAAGAQLGTLFAASSESIAHENFKKAFVRANARDAMPSVQLDERFPVIPVRGLTNEGTKRFLRHQAEVAQKFQAGELDKAAAQLEIEHFWAGALRRAVIEGDVESGSVMAGQSVGMVTEILPVAEILAALKAQAISALAARAERG
jgi:enoyl-[acyl-carrier protein] reductase II